MLRKAREARGSTIAEVAASLKMSPRQIEAIEGEDFSRLSGATFVRGFIRNYAKLLKIDAAPILAALPAEAALPQAALNAPTEVGVKMPAPGRRQGMGFLAVSILALALLVVALVLYFDIIDLGAILRRQSVRDASVQTIRPQVVQPLPQPVVAERPSSATVAGAVAEAKPADQSERPATPGLQQLIFSFDGSSWVEVRDAAGRTIFSQMNPKGTTQVVDGLPPFQLVVGNASNVRLQYNNQMIDLKPHTRVEVARLTLE